MRKEVLWAIIAGIVLGLTIAFGVWRINTTITPNKKTDQSKASPTPKQAAAGEFKIVLDKPENDDVVTENSVTVSGLTKPSSWVTLSGEGSDYIVQSDTSGAFTEDVNLVAGVNQIKITAFEVAGSQSATGVLVVYSSSFQTKTVPVSSPDANASGTSDIRAKVAQDVANTLSRPKAYIGTVTDITDSTIQIKTAISEIKQISLGASTSVINSVGPTAKQVKPTDIAIGDIIVAMGYIDGNSVLSAQRILVTAPITEPKISIKEARLTAVAKKILSVNNVFDNTGDSVKPDSKTDIETIKAGKMVSTKLGNLSAGDVIIYVVATDDKGVSSVRSIFQVLISQG
jgi:hypothetical protein